MILVFLQLFVFLDLLHEEFGWVKNQYINLYLKIMCKVVRRFHIYFLALWFIREVQLTQATGLMLLSWGILDLVRYPFYALHTWRVSPYWLTYLRYTTCAAFYVVSIVVESKLILIRFGLKI